MKNDNKGIFLYITILFFILAGCLTITLFVIPNFFQEFARIAILVVWVVLALIAIPIDNDHTRFKGKKEKIKTTLIIVIIYYIIYFLLGLIFGYRKSPYSRAFLILVKNFIYVVGLVALQDFVRSKLINNERKKLNYFIFTVLFIILRLDFTQGIEVFSSGDKIFEYVASVIVPEIAKGCVYTYLAIAGGTLLVYAYSIPVAVMQVVLPIFPDLDWFLTSVFDILISLILFLYNNYEHTIKTKRMTRKEKKKISPLKTIPSLTLMLFVVVFVAGLLPVKPIAIMSYSMVPTFSRGAVVFSVSIKEKDLNKLQKGDILHYRSKYGEVIHRIIDIKEKDGKLTFQTQGDNNNAPDNNWVEAEDVIGYVDFYIPYVGYPSVWFSEKVLGRKSFISIE